MKSKHTTKRSDRKSGSVQMVTKSLDEIRVQASKIKSKIDWARLRSMSEDEVEANALTDEDNQPLTDVLIYPGSGITDNALTPVSTISSSQGGISDV